MPQSHRPLLACLALSFSSAVFAQSSEAVGTGYVTNDKTGTARGVETITVTVPVRFGLHLHRNAWTLDLNTLSFTSNSGTAVASVLDAPRCYRAGEHVPLLGTDQRYGVNGSFLDLFNLGLLGVRGDSGPDDLRDPYDAPAQLNWQDSRILPVHSYPGLERTSNGKLSWKGPIMCVFQSIIEHFANVPGARLTAELGSLSSPLEGTTPFPDLVLLERPTPQLGSPSVFNEGAFILNREQLGPRTLLQQVSSSTQDPFFSSGGWQDSNLLEALILDGVELQGSYGATLTFSLSDLSQP